MKSKTENAIKFHNQAIQAAQSFRQAESVLLEILEQIDRNKFYLHFGYPSLFQYSIQELKLSESVIYNLITVMRKAREVPELAEAIRLGEITLSNARKIVPVLNSKNKNEWLTNATTLSNRKLEKEIVKIRPLEATHESARYVNKDRLKVELGLSENAILRLRKAQDLVSKSMGRTASLEDTIQKLTEFYLQHKDPVEKAKRVIAKKGSSNEVRMKSESKTELGAGCIATEGAKMFGHSKSGSGSNFNRRPIQPVTLQVETRQPIPAATLHQVHLRDQNQCTYLQIQINGQESKCKQSRWTEIHHVTPVSKGGSNDLENLTTLCADHHRWVHNFDHG